MKVFEAHEDEVCQLSDSYVDDRTGEILDAKLTKEARRKEITTMEVMGVYRKVLRDLVTARGKKTGCEVGRHQQSQRRRTSGHSKQTGG